MICFYTNPQAESESRELHLDAVQTRMFFRFRLSLPPLYFPVSTRELFSKRAFNGLIPIDLMCLFNLFLNDRQSESRWESLGAHVVSKQITLGESHRRPTAIDRCDLTDRLWKLPF